ncbi:MAG: glycosyltransferase [Planctomycetaceae bacterium]|nr:glycosyltransferase [Planctomycetaceae bacterium]
MPESPVRIAFCITELDPGGAERALVRIVTGLDRKTWEPHVYCLAGHGPLVDKLEAAGVPVTCLGAGSPRDVSVIRRLIQELRQLRPEILQTFLFHANAAGRFAAWRARVPVVVAGVRVVEPDARWRMLWDGWTRRLVDHTVCVSRGVADRYRKLGYRDDQLTVVPNGVDIERFTAASPANLSVFGIPPEARTVLSIGRLHPQKGQRDLIAAFDRCVRSGHTLDAHLLIVGDGPDRAALEDDVRSRGLGGRVHFAGWQPEVAPLLRAADLFVLSSLWEGMPNVLLEAMAAGRPCVATDVEGVGELVIDGETGLLVRPSAAEMLSDAITRLLQDDDLATRLAATGQQRVREKFSWTSTIRGFEAVWRTLLTRKGRMIP